MARFTEVAERVWVARYDWFDVNVTLVGGERGLLVVDTHSSELAAREVVADVRRLGAGEVVGVVNTHEHFDHTFGNVVLREEYGDIEIHAHEWAAAHTLSAGERIKREYAGSADEHAAEVIATRIVAAERTFSSARTLDLGDRLVELIHPGRGHTGGDLIVRIEDADTILAGDLIEESALRNGVPGFGGDCYPMEWPSTLDLVLSLITERTVVVPGHGAPVGRDFVQDQRAALGVVAETIRDLAGRGIPVDQALAEGDWPYPPEELAHAVRRGYEHLPRAQKRLPLI
jgi:glyoxylase-like metal-dependent hydrolase (beta-lactamase superfamily II)